MFGRLAHLLRAHTRSRGRQLPVGYNWAIVLAFDTTIIGIGVIAVLQRPDSSWPVGLLTLALCLAPLALFYVANIEMKAPIVWLSWTAAATVLFFATSAPIDNDFTPLIGAMMIGEVASLTGVLGGFLAFTSAATLLVIAAAQHRVDSLPLYFGILGMSWLVGYLVHTQTQLMQQQQDAQDMLAQLAAADERRRIAREVHDVVAHSLSVTLLHLTGARRGLQQDHIIDDAVQILERAEHLGRQAMADIRRTVGLLDDSPMSRAPEPGVEDIADLVDDFARAGLDVRYEANGRTASVSAAVGLTLYRAVQESLSNIAKHAPDCEANVLVRTTRSDVSVTVTNRLPVPAMGMPAADSIDGRGVRGMRQRVGLHGGIISVGPTEDGWSVRMNIPLEEPEPPAGCRFRS